MKANKQEKVIAGITASVLGFSAIALFVSGLGENKDGIVEDTQQATTYVVESTLSTEESTDKLLNISGVDTNIVGNIEQETEETETGKQYMAPSLADVVVMQATDVAISTSKEEVIPYKYANTFLVNVEQYLNVRVSASTDAEVVGKIYVGGGGTVTEKGAEWSKIVSGDVVGYINNAYVWFAEDAEAHMPEVCSRYAVSNTDCLRVRTGPGTEYDVITVINTGTEVQVLSVEGDWAKVNYIGTEAYISAQYLEMEYVIESGITIEAELEAIRLEQERIEAEKKAQEEAEAKRQQQLQQAIANSKFTETVQTSPYNVSEEEAYLLACTVAAEAGSESYEGKLAVANIILNRLNGGYYGSTIYDVVYARGQFSVVTDGALNRVFATGPNAESIQAAKDALSGKNNVPQYTNFCALSAANYGAYAEYSIICCQVFYRR